MCVWGGYWAVFWQAYGWSVGVARMGAAQSSEGGHLTNALERLEQLLGVGIPAWSLFWVVFLAGSWVGGGGCPQGTNCAAVVHVHP